MCLLESPIGRRIVPTDYRAGAAFRLAERLAISLAADSPLPAKLDLPYFPNPSILLTRNLSLLK